MTTLIYKRNLVLSIYILLQVTSSCSSKKNDSCNLPVSVTYTNQIATAIETNCFLCHAEDTYIKKAARYKLYDYPSLKKAASSGQLIGSITHATGYIAMPYRKSTKIDSCTIELIKKWVQTGMQE